MHPADRRWSALADGSIHCRAPRVPVESTGGRWIPPVASGRTSIRSHRISLVSSDSRALKMVTITVHIDSIPPQARVASCICFSLGLTSSRNFDAYAAMREVEAYLADTTCP
jgi:hypothetical protein